MQINLEAGFCYLGLDWMKGIIGFPITEGAEGKGNQKRV